LRTCLVTGFLGAGKTTFVLQRLRQSGGRVAVLVNEFGQLGIDGACMRAAGGLDVVEMPGGCICCSQRDGLVESVRQIAQELRPELLIIEPSGIAESSELLKALSAPSLAGVIRLEAVLAIVDAETFLEFAAPDGFGAFFLDQVVNADLVLVNKADLVGEDVLAAVERRIAQLSPSALVQQTTFCQVAGDLPSGVRAPSLPLSSGNALAGPAGLAGLECLSLTPGRELSGEELDRFLAELSTGRFGRVMRGKGFVPVQGQGLLNLQIVGQRQTLEPLPPGVDARLTLIGHALEGERLRKFFSVIATAKE
jgi:G3E family GTPase